MLCVCSFVVADKDDAVVDSDALALTPLGK